MAKIFLAIGHGVQTDGTWDSGCVDGNYTEAGLMKPIVGAAIPVLEAAGVEVHTDYPENDMNITACVAYANANGMDLYVSSHCDYSGAPSGTYPIVFPGSADGYRAAQNIDNSVRALLGLGTRGILQRDDYEVANTNMPAVIFETGSIRADIETILNADAYGQAIAYGILDYLGVAYDGGDIPASTPTPAPNNSNPYGFTSVFSADYYLSYGDGPDPNIGQFQRDCNLLGYWGANGPLTVDNLYGSECQYACECIQRFHGLEVDGEFGRLTDIAMMTEVATVQEALNKFGYNLAVDGVAGTATVAATKDFQAKHGLEPDGVCGAKTRAPLGIA